MTLNGRKRKAAATRIRKDSTAKGTPNCLRRFLNVELEPTPRANCTNDDWLSKFDGLDAIAFHKIRIAE
jgi:hypothetical protein